MRKSAALLTLVSFLLQPVSGGALASPPTPGGYLTNVELMQVVVEGCVDQVTGEMPTLEGEAVLIRALAGSDIDWLVENALLRGVEGWGVAVRVEPSKGAALKKKKEGSGKGIEIEVDTPPALAEGGEIAYPEGACERGFEGSVQVQLLINEQGSVANVVVEESSGEPFESAVVEGVQAFRYTPAQKDDKAVPGTVLLRFDFPLLEEGCESARAPGRLPGGEEEEGAAPEGKTEEPLPSSSPDEKLTVLLYRVSEMELRYPDVGRRFWIGPKRVDRYARVRLDLRLQRGENLVWARSAEHYVSDTVPYGALPFLENENFEFAKPVMPSGSLGRFVEPLVVAGLIGGLVALFYANQTGS
jgi:TonB family protein